MAKENYSVEVVKTDLEINEELPLHEKGWVARNIGLVFIYLLVILASFGLFGDGLLSKRQVLKGTASIHYERFHRQEARNALTINVSPNQNNLVVSFESQYLEKFRIETIVPDPREVKIQNGRLNYVFDGQGAVSITFYLIPQSIGPIEGNLLVNNNEFQLSQFIFP